MMMIYQFLVLICIQIIFSWLGFIFLDAEILRGGNEQLLNNLDESVVILEENSQVVLFVNDAAKNISKKQDKQNISIELFESLGDKMAAFDSTTKLFAHIEPTIFKDQHVDSHTTIRKIKSLRRYQSI